MNQLKVTGTQEIGDYQFTGIEGGFGEGKKAMLVKDIAEIHGQPLKEINRRINDNRKWFEDGVDIIDLKSEVGLSHHEISNFGFSQNAINRSNNIYVLSEQGYSNLLKILEDDTAWIIYKKFVKDYFGMRKTIKQQTSNLSPELQMFNQLFQASANVELEQKRQAEELQVVKSLAENVEKSVDNISEIVALSTSDWRKQSQTIIRKIAYKLGAGTAYQEIGKQIYQETERAARCSLKTRLTNMRKTMALEGASKSSRDKKNYLDVIDKDPKLVNIYMHTVKQFAIKHQIDVA